MTKVSIDNLKARVNRAGGGGILQPMPAPLMIDLIDTLSGGDVGTLEDGTAVDPSIGFASDGDTGFYLDATGVFAVTAGGTVVHKFSSAASAVNFLQTIAAATGTNVIIKGDGTDAFVNIEFQPKGTGQVLLPAGSESKPGLAFAPNTTAGLFDTSASSIAIASAAKEVMRFTNPNSTSGVNFFEAQPGVAGGPALLQALGADTNIGLEFLGKGSAGVNVAKYPVTQVASYTLVRLDAYRYVRMSAAAGVNLTVPPNSSVPFPLGTWIPFRQVGAGAVTVVPGSGVTVNSMTSLISPDVGSTGFLFKVGTNEWDLAFLEDGNSGGGGGGGISAIVNKTASYTPVLGEANAFIRIDVTDPTTAALTVPPTSSVNFPLKTELHLRQVGSGAVSFAEGAGVTINKPPELSLTLLGQGYTGSVIHVATDEWDLHGSMVLA